MRDLPQKVIRAFRALVNWELNGNREKYRQQYSATMDNLAHWLALKPWEVSPLNLDKPTPPAWVMRFPELNFLWQHAHAAFEDRRAILRGVAERRSA